MSTKFHRLQRLRPRLRKSLAFGFERAIFSHPQGENPDVAPIVIEGPGASEVSDHEFEALWARALSAAEQGYVKICIVLHATRRLEIDARHGQIKTKVRDAATFDKMMGHKQRTLRPDDSASLLRAIGLMNADGSISTRHARKYKQVNHFVELCRPVWEELLQQRSPNHTLRILDLACGNSYLSFVLVEALRLASVPATLLGVDVRSDFIERSRARAQSLEFENMRFEVASIRDAHALAREALEGAADLVLALHACDVATDEALALAIESRTAILCAPCCHAEVARQIDARSKGCSNEHAEDHAGVSSNEDPARLLPALAHHGLLRRSYGELLTDAVRIEMLEAFGYEVTLLEFVAAEHSAKNLLIRAILKRSPDLARLAQIEKRCAELQIAPRLLNLQLQRELQR